MASRVGLLFFSLALFRRICAAVKSQVLFLSLSLASVSKVNHRCFKPHAEPRMGVNVQDFRSVPEDMQEGDRRLRQRAGGPEIVIYCKLHRDGINIKLLCELYLAPALRL